MKNWANLTEEEKRKRRKLSQKIDTKTRSSKKIRLKDTIRLLKPEERTDFKKAGVKPDVKRDWDKAGVKPDVKRDWDKAGVKPDVKRDWDKAGVKPSKSFKGNRATGKAPKLDVKRAAGKAPKLDVNRATLKRKESRISDKDRQKYDSVIKEKGKKKYYKSKDFEQREKNRKESLRLEEMMKKKNKKATAQGIRG